MLTSGGPKHPAIPESVAVAAAAAVVVVVAAVVVVMWLQSAQNKMPKNLAKLKPLIQEEKKPRKKADVDSDIYKINL